MVEIKNCSNLLKGDGINLIMHIHHEVGYIAKNQQLAKNKSDCI